MASKVSADRTASDPPVFPPEPSAQVLLRRALEIYQQNFNQSAVPRKWLSCRGIDDSAILDRSQVGWSDGSLPSILPDDLDVIEDLTALGLIDANGREHLAGCLIFPTLSSTGSIDNLWAFRPDGRSRFLAGRGGGCFNLRVARGVSDLLVVSDVIDALSLVASGCPNVIALDPISGTMDFGSLREWGVQRLTRLQGDRDAAAKPFATKRSFGDVSLLHWETVVLRDTAGPNALLISKGPRALAEAVSGAMERLGPASIPGLQLTPDGFSLTIGPRRYDIRGLDRSPRRLKATIHAGYLGRLHVDVVDFYSARARRHLVQGLVRLFDEAADLIEADVAKLLSACEARVVRPSAQGEPHSSYQMSESERTEGEALGRDPRIIELIAEDFNRCGIVGEHANTLLCYLVMTSRKLPQPLSVMNLSSSGAGKSTLQDATLAFCPPEDVVKVTHLSGKALFHKECTSLRHKVLAIEEEEGARRASYALRNLISSGELRTEVAARDPASGRLVTATNRVEGPTAVFVTASAPDLDAETKSRFFVTTIDESREQTCAILERQRHAHTLEAIQENEAQRDVRRRHHAFQRLLQPLRVINPAATELVYLDDRLSSRRDQSKLLRLIQAVAFLRQLQKPIRIHGTISYIEVDDVDLRIAAGLVQEFSRRSGGELSPPGRKLLHELNRMRAVSCAVLNSQDSKPPPFVFTRQQIREFTGLSEATLHRHLTELLRFEHVVRERGGHGGPHRYRLYWRESETDARPVLVFPSTARTAAAE